MQIITTDWSNFIENVPCNRMCAKSQVTFELFILSTSFISNHVLNSFCNILELKKDLPLLSSPIRLLSSTPHLRLHKCTSLELFMLFSFSTPRPVKGDGCQAWSSQNSLPLRSRPVFRIYGSNDRPWDRSWEEPLPGPSLKLSTPPAAHAASFRLLFTTAGWCHCLSPGATSLRFIFINRCPNQR